MSWCNGCIARHFFWAITINSDTFFWFVIIRRTNDFGGLSICKHCLAISIDQNGKQKLSLNQNVRCNQNPDGRTCHLTFDIYENPCSAPLNFPNTRSHLSISRSVTVSKGILYFKKLGGHQLNVSPCTVGDFLLQIGSCNKSTTPDNRLIKIKLRIFLVAKPKWRSKCTATCNVRCSV